jgi:PAS domain S-box-containing protein
MMAEITAGWGACFTSFALIAATTSLWKAQTLFLLAPAAVAILCGPMIRWGWRPVVPAIVLAAAMLMPHIAERGGLSGVTPVLLAHVILSASLNVAVATTLVMLAPRRGAFLIPLRRPKLQDLIFVIAMGSFCATALALGRFADEHAAAIAILAVVIHLAVVLIARKIERTVQALTHRQQSGPVANARRQRGPLFSGLFVEAARLFLSSIRENQRLRRMTVTQGLRLESARLRVNRMQQAVTLAERSAREKESARAKAAAAASDMDARWRAFLETLPDALIIVDQNGAIEFANGAVHSLLGYMPDQLSGEPLSVLVPPRLATRHLLERPSAQLESPSIPNESETMILSASGKERELALRMQEYSVLGHMRLSIRLRDVSGLKYLLKELKQARSAMGSGERSRDQFIATMSHEIRTPLHGLMATIDMLRNEPLTQEGSHRLAIARTSAKTLLNIANDVLDLSRIEAGAISLERRAFALQSVLNDALDEARARAELLNFELSVHVTGHLPPSFLGDPARIKQILRNLLSNALKFTTEGSVTLHAHYENDKCIIDVKDTGEGIPEGKRESVFEPFVQADTASSRRFGGAGLGLPISRRLAEAMGGTLVLLRTSPRGSTFRLSLPLQASDEPPLEEQSQRILKIAHGHILVVEDDSASQYVARTLLESLNCSVTVAATGLAALEALKEEQFDLVFMDCEMPGLDGYETTRRIREVSLSAGARRLPIIGMTASTMSADRQRCFDAGMEDILPKPFSKAALNEMLGKWLSSDAAPVTGASGISERVKSLVPIDTSVFDELWQSLQWRMPAMHKIYDSFLTTTAETLELLNTLPTSRNFAEAGRRLHSLLGSAGLVGAKQVEYLAAWLTDAVKERRDRDIEIMLEELRDALSLVQQDLERRFAALVGKT